MAAAVVVASHEAADAPRRPRRPPRVPAGLGVRARRRSTSPSTPTSRRSPAMHAVLPIGARPTPASASTTWPTSTLLVLRLLAALRGATRSASTCGHDDRPVTVTGGLPFAGGAASNYLTHALATMVGVLRDDPGSLGLVSRRRHAHDQARRGALLDRAGPGGHRPGADAARRDGADRRAPRRPGDGRRVLGRPRSRGRTGVGAPRRRRAGRPGLRRVEDPDDLAALEAEEWVGRTVTLAADGAVNRSANLTPGIRGRRSEHLFGMLLVLPLRDRQVPAHRIVGCLGGGVMVVGDAAARASSGPGRVGRARFAGSRMRSLTWSWPSSVMRVQKLRGALEAAEAQVARVSGTVAGCGGSTGPRAAQRGSRPVSTSPWPRRAAVCATPGRCDGSRPSATTGPPATIDRCHITTLLGACTARTGAAFEAEHPSCSRRPGRRGSRTSSGKVDTWNLLPRPRRRRTDRQGRRGCPRGAPVRVLRGHVVRDA